MLIPAETPDVLRRKIREDIEYFDLEELRKLYKSIAEISAEKAIKLADKHWIEKSISRHKIKKEVENYRKSKK